MAKHPESVQSLLTQRRVPRQKRSRARYDKVLATARELIAAKGNDAVSMREIAVAADIPIASVYQYFPDKNGLLWTLFSEVIDELETEWDTARNAATTADELEQATTNIFISLVKHCETDPAFARLWLSVQANAVLAELDHAFNLRLADTYTEKLAELQPDVDRDVVWHSVLLLATLSSTALQLAVKMPANGQTLLAQFQAMAEVHQQQVRSPSS